MVGRPVMEQKPAQGVHPYLRVTSAQVAGTAEATRLWWPWVEAGGTAAGRPVEVTAVAAGRRWR